MENGVQGNVFAQTAEAVNENSIAGDTKGTFAVKVGLAQMLKGGVIMDVVTPEQAKIAEEAGACAGMCCIA
jgi:pyridoxal 5'-phosphate synthase pdxS subunit